METRSTKELLQLVLNEGNKRSEEHWFGYKTFEQNGLCGLITSMYGYREILNNYEFNTLRKFISDNRPRSGSKHYSKRCAHSPFYWRIGAWNPRKLWLEDQIKNM
jgi:hypothetical protein